MKKFTKLSKTGLGNVLQLVFFKLSNIIVKSWFLHDRLDSRHQIQAF